MKSKTVAVSAISAALIAVLLIVGAYFEIADLFTVVIASVFTLLPIYLKSYRGSLLACFCGGIIAFICSGFNFISLVFPAYFAFFGIYPIVKSKMIDKSFNKIAGFIIGAIWFLAVSYGLYFYYTLIMNGVFEGLPLWISQYMIYFVAIISIIFFAVYDRFIYVVRRVIYYYLGKILK